MHRAAHTVLACVALSSVALANNAVDSPTIALSTGEILLAILKYVGVAVGTASGIWALFHKLSDDQEGVRRLTPAGKAALGLTAGGFLVATAAAGLELVLANMKSQNQLLVEAAERARAADNERRAADRAARFRDQLLKNHTLTLLSEGRRQADATAHRLLALEVAAQEERRDAQLALRVSRGTAAEQRNTMRVLGSIWEGTHRVEGHRIEVLANHDCTSRSTGGDVRIIGEGSQVMIILLPAEALAEGPSHPLAAVGYAQTGGMFSLKQEEIALGPEELGRVVRFHTFFTLEPDALSSPHSWRGSSVRLIISGPTAGNLPSEVAGSGAEDPMNGLPATWPQDNSVSRLLPCRMSVNLVVNGRDLVTASGPIGLREGTPGPTFISEIPLTPVDNDRLPVFAS